MRINFIDKLISVFFMVLMYEIIEYAARIFYTRNIISMIGNEVCAKTRWKGTLERFYRHIKSPACAECNLSLNAFCIIRTTASPVQ